MQIKLKITIPGNLKYCDEPRNCQFSVGIQGNSYCTLFKKYLDENTDATDANLYFEPFKCKECLALSET